MVPTKPFAFVVAALGFTCAAACIVALATGNNTPPWSDAPSDPVTAADFAIYLILASVVAVLGLVPAWDRRQATARSKARIASHRVSVAYRQHLTAADRYSTFCGMGARAAYRSVEHDDDAVADAIAEADARHYSGKAERLAAYLIENGPFGANADDDTVTVWYQGRRLAVITSHSTAFAIRFIGAGGVDTAVRRSHEAVMVLLVGSAKSRA